MVGYCANKHSIFRNPGMVISNQKNFIFIHIPKTAGTSVAKKLHPYANPRTMTPWRAIRRALPIGGPVNPEKAWFEMHDTAEFVRQKLSAEVYDRYFRFAFVRSPYTHAYSHYHFLKTYVYKKYANAVNQQTFEAYLEWRLKGSRKPFRTRVQRFAWLEDQTSFIYDHQENCLVNFVGRFEHIQQDCEQLAQQLDMPDLKLEHHRKGTYKKGLDPSELSQAELDLIHELYHRDFENFQYARQ